MDTKMLLEFMYILCGIVLLISGVYSFLDKNNPKRVGSAAFWIIFGFLFKVKTNIPGEYSLMLFKIFSSFIL